MKYQLINTYEPYTSVLETTLHNRNISNENYLNLKDDVLNSPWLLDNINLAKKILLKHCRDRNSKVLIVVDSDCDGYTSAAAMFNYLLLAFPDIENRLYYAVHPKKDHGIIINDYILANFNLIIVPDAGSNSIEEQEKLYEAGIDLIVLDHHAIDEDVNSNDRFALVNNQLSVNYPNKMISGVGVVWKFLQVLDKELNLSYADMFLDLVAVGMAADMQSLQESETAYLIRTGLKQIKNPFISTLIKNSSFTIKDITEVNYITVSFYIAPLINAITRVGTIEERILLFDSFLLNHAYRLVPSTKRGHKAGDMEILVEQAYRIGNNVKTRQKNLKEEGSLYIKRLLADYDINNSKAIVLNIHNHLDKGLVGLVANEIAAEYQRPVVLVSENEEELIGSMRGYDKSELKDFKSVLEKCSAVNWVRGHSSAAGCALQKGQIEQLQVELNNELQNYDFSIKYDIDYIFSPIDDANWISNQIIQIGHYNYLWGRGCEEPLILLKDFLVPVEKIRLLARGTLRIDILPNISAIKFHISEDEYLSLIEDKSFVKMNIVGTCSINKWNNQEYAQIKIIDYETLIEKQKWVY